MTINTAIIVANAFTIDKCRNKKINLPKNLIYLDNLTGDCFRNFKNGYAGKIKIEEFWNQYEGISLTLINEVWESIRIVQCTVSIETD